MKKAISLLFVFAIILTTTSCRKIESAESVKTSESTAEKTVTQSGADYNNSVEGANRPESWAVKCPYMAKSLNEFYIVCDGIANYYFYRNTYDLKDWINTEFNIDGWYLYYGRIISADGKNALEENCEPLSPFVTYNAVPYDGPLPSSDESTTVTGTVFALNSCTPYALNGIRTFTHSSILYFFPSDLRG